MAKKIFISATGQDCGKTTTSLSLLHLAREKYARIGFIKPIGPKPVDWRGHRIDMDPATIAAVYGWEEKVELMCPVVIEPGMTQQFLRGELPVQRLEDKILAAVKRLENECDFLIIEGAGHSGVGAVIGLSNARVAALVGAPVMMVTGGGVGSVVDAVAMNLALYRQENAEVRALVVNKLTPAKRDRTLEYLRLAFREQNFAVLGGFNYQPILADPTITRLARVLNLQVQGNQQELMRIIHHVQIAAASTQRVFDTMQDSTMLIVTSSRDELLVTLSNLYEMEEYHDKIAGLVIAGVAPVAKTTQLILDKSNIPYLRTPRTTADIFLEFTADVSKLTAEDTEKISLIHQLAELRYDFAEIDRLFA
ncbi:MAG: AAA family ATPase [Desulfuromonadaceae bacterium]|nr:AAA family ATPase [Desulfuromonadaceae bacterium]